MMRIPAKSGLIVAALVSALSLSACGGATVEDDSSTSTSVAPLERSPRSSETASPSSDQTTENDADSEEQDELDGQQSPAPRPEPQPEDQRAQEIDEIPAQEVDRSAEDVSYLGVFSDNDIDISGVEDQMIATAQMVCSPDDAGIGQSVIPAVAGQLVEQGRTDRTVDETVTLIEDSARQAYC